MRLGVGCLLLLFMALSITEAIGSDPTPKSSVVESVSGKKIEPIKSSEDKSKKRVLIYNPHIGHYHRKFMTTIAELLHKSGKYNVTMLDSIVNHDLPTIVYTKGIYSVTAEQHPITAKYIENGNTLPEGLSAFWNELSWEKIIDGTLFAFENKVVNFSDMLKYQCKNAVDAFEKVKKIEEEFGKFDLAITEVFDLCGVGLFQLLKHKPSKIILASSIPLHEHLGEMLGLPKSFDVPTKFNTNTPLSHQTKFGAFNGREWVINAVQSAIHGQTMFGLLEDVQNAIFVEHMAGSKLRDLLKSAHSLIENVHPLLDLSKPTLNSIIPIGGITVDKPSNITDQEISETLEKAEKEKKKIVLVSFGTVMGHYTMTNETMKNLVDAFKEVKNAFFLWKVNRTVLDNKGVKEPPNVYINNWLPQNDLLASGKINLFVSHMGIGSFTEAAYHGVPFVSVPIFVDQHYNYVCAKRLGIARWVDKTTLAKSSEDLVVAIKEALKDEIMTNTSALLKSNLLEFGNQTKKMMDHINFIMSLPSDNDSIAFHNYHEGVSIRSIYHLFPSRMAYIIAWVCLFYVQFVTYLLFCCVKKNVENDVKENVEENVEEDRKINNKNQNGNNGNNRGNNGNNRGNRGNRGNNGNNRGNRGNNYNNGNNRGNNDNPGGNNGVHVEAKEDVKDIEGPVSKYPYLFFVPYYTVCYFLIDYISRNYPSFIYFIPHLIIDQGLYRIVLLHVILFLILVISIRYTGINIPPIINDFVKHTFLPFTIVKTTILTVLILLTVVLGVNYLMF